MGGRKGVDPYDFYNCAESANYQHVLWNVSMIESLVDSNVCTIEEIVDILYASGLSSDSVDITMKEFEQRRGSWN
jgi:hypothetical protein